MAIISDYTPHVHTVS